MGQKISHERVDQHLRAMRHGVFKHVSRLFFPVLFAPEIFALEQPVSIKNKRVLRFEADLFGFVRLVNLLVLAQTLTGRDKRRHLIAAFGFRAKEPGGVMSRTRVSHDMSVKVEHAGETSHHDLALSRVVDDAIRDGEHVCRIELKSRFERKLLDDTEARTRRSCH